MAKLRYEEKTRELRGLIFKVRNELKSGWSEEVFHQALLHAVEDNKIPVVSKPRRAFLHRGVEVHLFEPDLIVWDTIILELKALPYQKGFVGKNFAQLIHYLKFWGKDLGLLVNFAPPRVKIQRVVWDEPELDVLEEYDKIKPHLSEQDKPCLRQIRHHILTLAQQYGLGYPETMYRKLLAVEAAHHQLSCTSDVNVATTWNGHNLPSHTTQHLCIADSYLVHIRSLLEHLTIYDFTSTKTYLKALGLTFGLVVNFGSKQLQIYGVKADE